jgi:hypothetical protein
MRARARVCVSVHVYACMCTQKYKHSFSYVCVEVKNHSAAHTYVHTDVAMAHRIALDARIVSFSNDEVYVRIVLEQAPHYDGTGTRVDCQTVAPLVRLSPRLPPKVISVVEKKAAVKRCICTAVPRECNKIDEWDARACAHVCVCVCVCVRARARERICVGGHTIR